MGYLYHKALLVNGWDAKTVRAAHAEVAAFYDGTETHDYDLSGLVSEVVQHSTNGGASFFIAPDGSKEGWLGSQMGDQFMARAKEIIGRHQWVDWCEVQCGGDDNCFEVLDSSALAADTRSDETPTAAQSEGCQSGGGTPQRPTPPIVR